MYIKKTEKKLLKRLEKIEKVCPITNEMELLLALEKITDDEVASEKPDICLIDEAVNFSLYINGCEGEKNAEAAKHRFYERIMESKIVSFAKKRLLRISKIAIVATVIMTLSIGAFAGAISFGIVDMDFFAFRSLEKDKVYEDGKHTVVISDDMFVYYDSIDEMMEGEGLESIYLPAGETEQIRAATIYYTSELKDRTIMIKTNGLWLRITLDILSFRDNAVFEKVGNFDIDFFEYDDRIQANWICDGKEYSVNTYDKEELIKIIKSMREYRR